MFTQWIHMTMVYLLYSLPSLPMQSATKYMMPLANFPAHILSQSYDSPYSSIIVLCVSQSSELKIGLFLDYINSETK